VENVVLKHIGASRQENPRAVSPLHRVAILKIKVPGVFSGIKEIGI
jgi:hypothetical protein